MNLTETNKYISFTLVILVWELIPTLVVIILFRIKRAIVLKVAHEPASSSLIASSSSAPVPRKSVFLESAPKTPSDAFFDQLSGLINWEATARRQSLVSETNSLTSSANHTTYYSTIEH